MKKKVIFGLGALLAGVASAVGIKKMMDKDYHTVPDKNEDEDRGVSPIDKKDKGGVQNLKADAINHGYKAKKY